MPASTAPIWLTARDVFRMTTKPFVISKLLVESSFNLLIGARKLGKTLVSTDIALAIAAGLPEWAGHKISPKVQGGLVIYVLGEGTGRFKFRLKACCESRGINPRMLDKSFVLYPRALNLLDAEAVQTFITDTVPAMTAKTGKRPVLIVFDTWSRCVTGAEDDKTFNTAVTHVDQIRRETGATVLALHHVPKSNTRTARGSGVLEAAIDAQFVLDGEQDASTFKFELDFARELSAEEFLIKTFERRTIQLEDVDPESGEFETSATIRLLDEEEAAKVEAKEKTDLHANILAQLKEGPKSAAAIREVLKRKKSVVTLALSDLFRMNRIIREGSGPATKYRLAPAPSTRGARLVGTVSSSDVVN